MRKSAAQIFFQMQKSQICTVHNFPNAEFRLCTISTSENIFLIQVLSKCVEKFYEWIMFLKINLWLHVYNSV